MRAHGRLGARADEPDHLHARASRCVISSAISTSPRGRRAVAGAAPRRLARPPPPRRARRGRGSAAPTSRRSRRSERRRRRRAARPRRAAMKSGVAADGAERAHRAVDAAGDEPTGGIEEARLDSLMRTGSTGIRSRGRSASQRKAAVASTWPRHHRDDDVHGGRIRGLATDQRLPAVGFGEVGAGVDVRVVDHVHVEALALEIADAQQILGVDVVGGAGVTRIALRDRGRAARSGRCDSAAASARHRGA